MLAARGRIAAAVVRPKPTAGGRSSYTARRCGTGSRRRESRWRATHQSADDDKAIGGGDILRRAPMEGRGSRGDPAGPTISPRSTRGVEGTRGRKSPKARRENPGRSGSGCGGSSPSPWRRCVGDHGPPGRAASSVALFGVAPLRGLRRGRASAPSRRFRCSLRVLGVRFRGGEQTARGGEPGAQGLSS